ncbi:MAG TPA: polyprenol monophosphomannose synthase [Vicinamibacterales bacterium]|nr:polyprenol monophosphomannose synthase [Vicinamibacterales bacterium]
MGERVSSRTGAGDVVVVVPTYNERENLPVLARRLMALGGVELLVVDDESPDGTGELAERLAARWPGRMRVLHRSGPRGLGRAYVDGLQAALATGAPLVCQMDADLSHDPAYLPDLVAAAAEFDLVIGSRYVSGVSVVHWPLRRILLSAAANRYIRAVTGLHIRDCTGGFRCWRREALARLPLDRIRSDGYAFMVELLFEAARRDCRIGEVPIIFVERRAGASKVSRRVLVESLLMPWRLRVRLLDDRLRRRVRGARRPPAGMREPEVVQPVLPPATPRVERRVLLRYR